MKQRWLFMALVIATMLLIVASCSLTSTGASDQNLSGRMLLWHALSPNETAALNQVIDSFIVLNPGVTVKVQVFSTTAELNQQFINAAAAGLGPDLLLTPSQSVPQLLDTHNLSPIDPYLTEAITARFSPAMLATLQFGGHTYGLPQSLDTLGLYVNRALVEAPATDLGALVEQANSGINVLMPINFTDAFWGLRAFGGQLADEDGMTVLDQGGFANWLAWLRDARSAPGMIQDTNRDLLRQQFMAGNAGYYIGYASELNQILGALDPATVEVYPLPQGPVAQAGPLVTSKAFLFSSVSSTNQRRLAAELAIFVTNVEQSSRLMRLARQVPANINVRINPRLYPVVAAFVSQARNGIPKPLRPEFDTAVRLGNEAYVRTLEGGESPAEVAFAINNSINMANGFETQDTPSYTCRNLGTLRLLVLWQESEALEALRQVSDAFHAACPLVIVEIPETSETQLIAAMSMPNVTRAHAVVSLVNQNQLVALLGETPGPRNLDGAISNEVLQRFAPVAMSAMRREANLYALPFTLRVDALYYNQAMVDVPAQTLDDLRTQAATGVPITLDTSFAKAFWGMRAFGAQPFASNGASILDQGGMAAWLTWLRESRDSFGIQLTDEGDVARAQFLRGESAYYVGGPEELSALREELGDNLRVTYLPSGPGGPAQPLVTVEGLALRADASESAQMLALDFMRFVTDLASQEALMGQGNKIPANGSVSTANDEFFSIFFEQAQTGYLLPAGEISMTLLKHGDAAYTDVLDFGEDPIAVVSELTAAINAANGIAVTPTPTAAPTETPAAEATPAPDEADNGGTEGGAEVKAE